MQRTKTYFLSDLHLGASYLDRPHERERMLTEFLGSIAADAARLYLVGDILDYWFEYRTVVPRGYVRFFGALAALADSSVRITWLVGNHDIWMSDYLRDELGIEIVDGPMSVEIDGRHFFISHGDGLGHLPLSFRFIRSIFRNRLCRRLYAAIHPRWTVGFAHRWSADNRGYGTSVRPVYEGRMRENVEEWACGYVADHPDTDFIVLGHHHVMVDKMLGTDCRLIILGDWIYNFSYAVFDGKNFQLKQIDSIDNPFNNISQ